MDWDEVVRGLVLSGSGVVLAFGTWWFARKAGLAPAQAALISTLSENGAALQKQVDLLRDELDRERSRRIALEEEVAELKDAIAHLAAQNASLTSRLGDRRRPSRGGSE